MSRRQADDDVWGCWPQDKADCSPYPRTAPSHVKWARGRPHPTPQLRRPGSRGPCVSPGSRPQQLESPQSHGSFPPFTFPWAAREQAGRPRAIGGVATGGRGCRRRGPGPCCARPRALRKHRGQGTRCPRCCPDGPPPDTELRGPGASAAASGLVRDEAPRRPSGFPALLLRSPSPSRPLTSPRSRGSPGGTRRRLVRLLPRASWWELSRVRAPPPPPFREAWLEGPPAGARSDPGPNPRAAARVGDTHAASGLPAPRRSLSSCGGDGRGRAPPFAPLQAARRLTPAGPSPDCPSLCPSAGGRVPGHHPAPSGRRHLRIQRDRLCLRPLRYRGGRALRCPLRPRPSQRQPQGAGGSAPRSQPLQGRTAGALNGEAWPSPHRPPTEVQIPVCGVRLGWTRPLLSKAGSRGRSPWAWAPHLCRRSVYPTRSGENLEPAERPGPPPARSPPLRPPARPAFPQSSPRPHQHLISSFPKGKVGASRGGGVPPKAG